MRSASGASLSARSFSAAEAVWPGVSDAQHLREAAEVLRRALQRGGLLYERHPLVAPARHDHRGPPRLSAGVKSGATFNTSA